MEKRTAYETTTKYINLLIEDMNNTIDFAKSETYDGGGRVSRLEWAERCLHEAEADGSGVIRFTRIWMHAITDAEMRTLKDALSRGYNAAWHRAYDELYGFEEKRGEQR